MELYGEVLAIYSVLSLQVGLLAFHYQIPVISWGCTSPRLSDNSRYGTLSRVVGPLKKVSHAINGLCKEFLWKKVLIMADEDHYWQVSFMLKQFYHILHKP